jgi:hypothetical protein
VPRFGHPWHFAIEVEERRPPDRMFTRVDLWAARQLLTCDDPHPYIPQACCDLEHGIGGLLAEPDLALPWPGLSPEENHRRLVADGYDARRRFRFLDWGPTTDNIRWHIFIRGKDAIITVEFIRPDHHTPADLGRVFVAELPERELLLVLHNALSYLRQVQIA